MSPPPENVRPVLALLLPASILNDVKCFAFYDNHPQDERNIDITICTESGEVREYFQRDLVSSVNLENKGVYTEIKILRNKKCELFYLVAGSEQLTILSRKENLKIHKILFHVTDYKICDFDCSGEAVLHVYLKNCKNAVVPDDNYENFKPFDIFATPTAPPLNEFIITHLNKKLIEAKYSVKTNEKCLKEFLHVRQSICYSLYKKIHPKLGDCIFADSFTEVRVWFC